MTCPRPCLLLALLLCGTAALLQAQPRKRALLIGIGQYAAPDFKPLNASRGLKMMHRTLLNQGFNEPDIIELADAAATCEGIRQSLEYLRYHAGPGDIIVLHYYGHGTQIHDDNNDEADQLDEAIVPYDGQRNASASFKNLIRDDELGQWVAELRTQTGPTGQVLVLLDACHSGSGLRESKKRKYQQAQKRHSLSTDSEAGRAPLIAFYSSLPHQNSLEAPVENRERCALLTWAFCKAMAGLNPENTYRGLFERIHLLMMGKISRKQTPQYEGLLDQRIFGSKVEPPPPYFKTFAVSGPKEIVLEGGALLGLEAGASVALYPPETRDTTRTTPLARGTVTAHHNTLTECRVALDRTVPESQLLEAWTFLTARNIQPGRLALQIAMSDTAAAGVVSRFLGRENAFSLVTAESELTLRLDNGRLGLWTATRTWLWDHEYRPEQPETTLRALHAYLDDYLQARFLLALEGDDGSCRLGFAARPTTPAWKQEPGMMSIPVRPQRDTVLLRITNSGDAPVFYTVIGIDAANKMTILFPAGTATAAEYRLAPGETSPPHPVVFRLPGREVLKLVATPRPTDLRDAIRMHSLASPSPNGLPPIAGACIRTLVLDVLP